VLGGEQVYREAERTLAHVLLITHIGREHEGDIFFPEIDPLRWQPVSEFVLRRADPELKVVRYRRRT
jgi:dihydrofolate reductase